MCTCYDSVRFTVDTRNAHRTLPSTGSLQPAVFRDVPIYPWHVPGRPCLHLVLYRNLGSEFSFHYFIGCGSHASSQVRRDIQPDYPHHAPQPSSSWVPQTRYTPGIRFLARVSPKLFLRKPCMVRHRLNDGKLDWWGLFFHAPRLF